MAQMERMHSRRCGESPTTPQYPTVEQLLREGEASIWSPPTTSPLGRDHHQHHDSEEDHTPQKKSVFNKVKEKAKKVLRHSLSNKKKHNESETSTPSWGVSLDDDEEEEEDAEYLGAPMYESELAPEECKENAKHHPREIHSIPETHVSPKAAKDNEKPLSPNNIKTITETVSEKLAPTYASMTQKLEPTYVSVSEKFKPAYNIVSEKLGRPAYNAMSETLGPTYNNISEKYGRPTYNSVSETLEPAYHTVSEKFGKPAYNTMSENLAPAYASISDATHALTSKLQGLTASTTSSGDDTRQPNSAQALPRSLSTKATRQSLAPPASPKSYSSPLPSKHGKPAANNSTEHIWDKGVSVKEYFMHKFEPGEDEKALSQVISKAISPKKSPSDAGVVEKVKEAVTSLLRNDDQYKVTSPNTNSAAFSSPHLHVSTNANEAIEEENHGRILQAN